MVQLGLVQDVVTKPLPKNFKLVKFKPFVKEKLIYC